MKRFSIALLALAAILAITPVAKASTLCSSAGQVTTGLVCTEGVFTFTFESISIIPPTSGDTLYFNSGLTVVSGDSVDLGFQVLGGVAADINMVYEVQGPAGIYQLNNSFLGGGVGDNISETACTGNPICGTQLAYVFNNTGGTNVYSGTFATNGTFFVNKDVSDSPYTFSEFTDSIDLAPEPSSLIMFGTGLLGLAGMLRYKFRKTS
ncbi:MAG TPA: PEP-CTERM sorting domain-containing protein [Terracidiphilus sp.]